MMKSMLIHKKLPGYNSYSSDFYGEVMKCYDYEVKNPTIYGKIMNPTNP